MRATVQATFVAGLHDFNELVAPPRPFAVVDDVGPVGDARSVVHVELARLVSGTADRMLECGSRLVGVAADQPLLSGGGRWPKIVQSERCIRMPLSLLLSCVLS